MSLASEYKLARLETGREQAALRRHKGLPERGTFRPRQTEPLPPKGSPDRAAAEAAMLRSAEIEAEANAAYSRARGYDPDKDFELMSEADWRHVEQEWREGWPGEFPLSRPVALAQPVGPERQTPGERRQRKGNSMKGAAFKKALAHVGLSQYRAAPFFGLSLRQVQRIAAGEYDAPKAVTILLRLMVERKMLADEVEEP